MLRDEQPILLADCPDCGRPMTLVTLAGVTWPTCVCCGGSGFDRDRACPHRQEARS